MKFDLSVLSMNGEEYEFMDVSQHKIAGMLLDWKNKRFAEVTIRPHPCNHRWCEIEKILDPDIAADSMTITCSKCRSSFELSHTLLTSCYQSGLKAEEYGF